MQLMIFMQKRWKERTEFKRLIQDAEQVGIFNVTFEPGCRNNWHIHHAKSGGGQILVCVAGRGYYQEEGKDAIDKNPEQRVVLLHEKK